MDPDIALFASIVLGLLAVPTMLSARGEGRRPRLAILVFLTALGLAGWALSQFPAPLSFRDIPDALLRVVARVLN